MTAIDRKLGPDDAPEVNRMIGVRLAAFMASTGRSRDKLASGLGVSTHMIARFESGNSAMTAVQLMLAARVLGITTAVLTGEESFKGGAA
ncbi:helix-turn-helix domain-containing protein [Kaistia sp. MMO-174]|uniref:helix-turn-helix domain-containing protein n=1 Tax=Kaistia sp. MMO-174 TaxID=3081256 RepID=UPI003018268C